MDLVTFLYTIAPIEWEAVPAAVVFVGGLTTAIIEALDAMLARYEKDLGASTKFSLSWALPILMPVAAMLLLIQQGEAEFGANYLFLIVVVAAKAFAEVVHKVYDATRPRS